MRFTPYLVFEHNGCEDVQAQIDSEELERQVKWKVEQRETRGVGQRDRGGRLGETHGEALRGADQHAVAFLQRSPALST